ncbi:FAD/NAD(P)-binding domain-containing protein [Stipitochalara longipes BDJ]|nr:FAD/NAD(P)-binding domain-containing protein [Stipitochalara longipes BDJ]
MNTRLKVIICGGGIAGFATALLLREDHDVTILEKSTMNQELGAAITLSMNASRLLRSSLARAGFDPVKARYVEAEKFQELHWKDLSVLLAWQMEMVTKKYNEPWWYFSRQDVHGELKRAALSPDGLGTAPHLELGADVKRVEIPGNIVHLKDGRTFIGDVIIGADGIHTTTGNSVFGQMKSVSSGFSAYRCMIPTASMRRDPDTAMLVDSAKVLMLIGPDRRIVAYPCSSWEFMNFVCIFPDETERRQQWRTKVTVEEMVEQFKDFHPSVARFLGMATDTGIWALRDRDPLSTLVKGSFALIGDAAHAMGPHQGQGGCQAIEDAEALRVVLKGATPEDVGRRLAIFDELRVERVKTVIEYTREMAPKKTSETKVNHKTTQTYSDYYWRYKMTQAAVEAMNKHGFAMTLMDPATGEISLW